MTISFGPGKFAVSALCLAATGAWAAEFGTVVSSTPVVAQVPVVQRQCYDEQTVVQPQRSGGGGALVGALFGAALGNAVGHGAGRAAATGLGMIAGAAIGDQAEANAAPPVATTAQRCRNVSQYESRTVGYDVVYDYQGVRRSVRLAQDPGDRIALEVSPVGALAPGRTAAAAPQPVYRSPADVSYDEEAPPPPPAPRVIYAPQPAVYINPWPYLVIGGGWYGGGPSYGGGHGGGWARHGHRR